MTCPRCQRANPPGDNFCRHCGQLLLDHCPRCQATATADDNFCGRCGLALTPIAQFQWGRAGPAAPAPQLGRAGSQPTTPEPAVEETEQPPATPRPLLERYLPKELQHKLEAARARGGMVGERRTVTMLFCDVKGSTAAAERLDPEEWTEIINGAFEQMIRPVYKYEGTVARLMGDAILAFFGAPIAHEDDPQRAVLAGLDIVAEFAPYRERVQARWGIDVSVRVGINTGLVVVGAVGSDLRMEYTAMGNAINVAARMEQTAAPGTVRIAQDTYKLVAPLFQFEELGGVAVKGKAEPVPAYRVAGRKRAARRLRGIEGLEADLVGREREMSRLREVLADLERGIGGLVFLLGDAGFGKSRLVQELQQGNGQRDGVAWLETASLSYESAFPYALFQRLLRRLEPNLGAEEAALFQAGLQALTAPFAPEEAVRYQRALRTLFGRPDPGGRPPLEGEHFKRELYAAMEAIAQARIGRRPTMLVLEDLHWADPASVALLLHLLSLVEEQPLVLLCTMRPDREAPAYRLRQTADAEYHHRYTELALRPLTEGQSDELVNRLLVVAELPEGLRARILERAGGNPFFVEEVVRTLIEKGAVVAEERVLNGARQRVWRAVEDGAALDIPDTLQGLLAARLDRLDSEARHIVQLAAVIGRSFYQRVLTALGQDEDLPTGEVEAHIGRLVRLEMIQEAARVPEVEYKFRNPLTQEIAYRTILRKRRQEFHRRVGGALEKLFPERLAELAPRLAFHFAEGQQADKALAYFTLAADSAFRLSALEEALANYERALQWAEAGTADSARLIHLYRRRGRTLELLLRYDEVMETFQDLEALGAERGDEAMRLAGLAARGLALYHGQRNFSEAMTTSQEALALARQLGDRAMEARCLWTLLVIYSFLDVERARGYGRAGLAIARELVDADAENHEHREQLALLLVDLTIPLSYTGELDLALQYAAEAQTLFEELGNLPMVSTAMQRPAIIHNLAGRYEAAVGAAQQAVDLDRAIGNDAGVFLSCLSLVENYSRLGDFAAFLAVVETLAGLAESVGIVQPAVIAAAPVVAYRHLDAIDAARELLDTVRALLDGDRFGWPTLVGAWTALAFVQAGELELAADLIERSTARSDASRFTPTLADTICQAQAEVALAQGKAVEALALVDEYLADVSAKGLAGMLPEKLLLKARILRQLGQADDAHPLLQHAHGLAAEQQARTVLWPICAELAELEIERGRREEAEALRREARTAIEFIAEHTGRDDLHQTFRARPAVQALLDP
ncbi:MAG: adenylate/guanylate cyclase domain-containing protein [Candidatus Promineifilaceae bacterium]|nr:adenylate/guanylate cyclase domain-containing protein [Candidatus Promineifilaceae bacterium]